MDKFNKFTQEQKTNIINALNNEKKHYYLEGIEITEEDAVNTLELIENGMETETAIDEVLYGIYETLY